MKLRKFTKVWSEGTGSGTGGIGSAYGQCIMFGITEDGELYTKSGTCAVDLVEAEWILIPNTYVKP